MSWGTKANLTELIEMLESIENSGERGFLENAIENIAKTNPDLEKRTRPLISALESASKETKESLITILGKLGGEDAQKAIGRFLSSPDTELRLKAVQAFEGWPNGAPLTELIALREGRS